MTRLKMLSAGAALVLFAGCGGGGSTGPSAREISMGGDMSARLTDRDPRLSDNTTYQVYRFNGHAGDMVQIDMTSTDFDTYLVLQDDAGRELTHDDDSGDANNARVMYSLPVNGTYRIIAKSYRSGAFGQYHISLARMGTATAGGNGSTIARGQLMTGRLTMNDPRLSDNSVYHVYMYRGRQGENLTIDVMSSDFDAFAILQDPNGNELLRDDDSGEGTNARITTSLPSTGIFRIVVNTYAAGSSGNYTLWVH